MKVLVEANVLAIGLDGFPNMLDNLPVRVVSALSAKEAARSLKYENFDIILSSWNLDNSDWFVRTIKRAKPSMPVVAIVEPGNPEQEIQARCSGASAVVTSVDRGTLTEIVSQLKSSAAMQFAAAK